MAEPSRDLTVLVESLLFAAGRPVSLEELQTVLEARPEEVQEALDRLDAALDGRGLQLQRYRDAVQLVTHPSAAPYVRRMLGLQVTGRLSTAALETLAVVAYRQPVTRAQIEAIRGVNSDHALSVLHARGLIQEVGRLETPGRPVLYGTTFQFLQTFGLRSLEDLPRVEGLEPPSMRPSGCSDEGSGEAPLQPSPPQARTRGRGG
jgi:segregation and condensation protein B